MKTIDRLVRVYQTAGDPVEGLTKVFFEILGKAEKLGHIGSRVTTSERAVVCAALNEQDRLWREFAKRVPGAAPDGFARMIQLKMPGIFQTWMEIRASIKMPRL